MKDEYDFSNAKRGAVATSKGKTRISIMLDDAVIEAARERAEQAGIGYQTLINNLLRHALLAPATHDLAPAPEKSAPSRYRVHESSGRYEVKALGQQLTELAEKINRALAEAHAQKGD